MRLGRRIYDNIRKATEFIFAVHIPIGGLALTPLLTGWPIILGPIHIALLELVIDPMCSLSFEAEPEEPDIMDRPPRAPDSPLVSRVLLGWSALQGTVAVAFLIALAAWAQYSGMDDAHFRSTCFAGLICAVLVLIVVNRSFRSGIGMHRSGHNLTFAVIMAFIAVIYTLLFLVESVASLFHFAVLNGDGIAEVVIMTAAMAVILTLAKRRFAKAIVG
ncbi:MAG: cation-translocating P-type ATPase [Novosphingobium sp.]